MIATLEEDDEVYFLPPKTFLKQYSLLVEAVYMTSQPKPEVPDDKKHSMMKAGFKLPVRNYRAYKSLRRMDKWLSRHSHQIINFFQYSDYEIPNPWGEEDE